MEKSINKIRKVKEYLTEACNRVQTLSKDEEETVLEICTEMQQKMIELGTELEASYQIENSRIIKWLEVCCELCYRICMKTTTKETFEEAMSYQLLIMEYEFYWSVRPEAYDFSVAAIIKNEQNIIEWLEYHRLVGVNHFYIYDNESTDGLKEKLQPYMDEGVVTYIYFPGRYQQMPAYNHAIEHFKYDTKWLAVIDGDEYLIPVEAGKTLCQVADEIEYTFTHHPMRYVNGVGAIGVNWRDYGTSGHKTKCDGLLIENYKYRAENDYWQNVHIKSIYNPRTVNRIDNPHFGQLASKYICISEKGSYIPKSYFYDSACEKIRINHYFSKSEEELVSKNQRGWPDRDLYREDSKEIHEASVECNKVYDPIMDRYIEALKERMKGR